SGASGSTFEENHGQAGVVDPDSKQNILQIAANSPDHTTLAAAVVAAELENVLVNPGPLTVFAPTNAAFDALPAGTVETLLKPENKAKLASIVTSHAAPGTFAGDLLKDGDSIYLATGQYVDVKVENGDTFVNGAKILGTVDASNGVVHVVDTVFLFD
ncbi:MAG: fasciclin domain-containing protein, partial [Rhodothermales bacterium]|nr:fasciclin domain-containing protein [Rhodothermales bacterium]